MLDLSKEYRFFESLIAYRDSKNPLAAKSLAKAYIQIMDDKPVSNSCRGLAMMVDTLDTIASNMGHHYMDASSDIAKGVTKLSIELGNMLVSCISDYHDGIAYYLGDDDDS